MSLKSDLCAEYLKRSLLANVYEVATETPVEFMSLMSSRLGARVFLKREDVQPIFSFKIRGAYNRLINLSPAESSRGVIAASAGNHGQGVALSASKLGIKATVVMPITTPTIKVQNVEALGASVVLFGDSYDEAYGHSRGLCDSRGLTYIHPYDDADVIAGQGTIGVEILRQTRDLKAIYVPVGGGGLIAGVGAVVKSLRPNIRIIAVEPEDSACMKAALHAGEPVPLETVGRFADGVSVRQAGDLTFQICREVVDECITVTNDEICAGIKDIFEDRRAVLEPAGALSYAGMKKHVAKGAVGCSLAIASGANLNFDSLRHVSERAEIGERRETILAVTIPERPGSFRNFCRALGERTVTEFNYRFSDPQRAHVFVGLKGGEDVKLGETLRGAGYDVTDLTDNEVAKLHIRHMVGGKSQVSDEKLISFGFPERSGALLQFLDTMDHPWNISLFHYRNHGSEVGRVLVGVQVSNPDLPKFNAFLSRLGYEHLEVTDDASCRLFL